MHKLRVHAVTRFILLLTMMAGAVYFSIYQIQNIIIPPLRAASTQKIQQLPHDDTINLFIEAADLLNLPPSASSPATLKIDPSLLKQKTQTRVTLALQLIFAGNKKYVLINDQFYTINDVLPDGRKIKDINDEGVVLSSSGKPVELLAWTPPLKVELKKSAALAAASPGSAAQAQSSSAPQQQIASSNQTSSINVNQALELLKNLQNINGKGK